MVGRGGGSLPAPLTCDSLGPSVAHAQVRGDVFLDRRRIRGGLRCGCMDIWVADVDLRESEKVRATRVRQRSCGIPVSSAGGVDAFILSFIILQTCHDLVLRGNPAFRPSELHTRKKAAYCQLLRTAYTTMNHRMFLISGLTISMSQYNRSIDRSQHFIVISSSFFYF